MILPLLLAAAPLPFDVYLSRPEPKFATRITASTPAQDEIELTSQTWQGIDWQHKILLSKPKSAIAKGTAVLFITGDGPRPGDYRDLALISGASQLPVAMLFNIPNQPIWDMKEDDLIAHTFEKYLATGDSTWPLLFPMAKSAIKAMDAVVSATKNSDNPITKFVVTGASKRGWTTWMVGASGDKRVIGLAPMVYDNLDIPKQMKRQIATWGDYSVQIQDYTRRGLQKTLATSGGKSLTSLIDPYVYRSRIKMPILMVNGTNDPYWVTDATSQYWHGLKMPKSLVAVPNAGHDLGTKINAIESIGAYARARATGTAFPRLDVSWQFNRQGNRVTVKIKALGGNPTAFGPWFASSESLDFRNSKWAGGTKHVSPIGKEDFSATEIQEVVAGMNKAILFEARFGDPGKQFSIMTPPLILKSPTP